MRNRSARKLAAALALTAVIGAACGSDSNSAVDSANGNDTPAAADAKDSLGLGTDTGASTLQAGLTSLLQEHVYLAGTATGTALSTGLDSEATKGAVDTLDENSVALADAIGSVYGDAAGDQFLELWRKHIGFFVDYTKAKAGNDAAAAQKALADLDGYRNDFGAFLSSANPNLTKQAVADSLVPHIKTLSAAIDAQVAKDPSAFSKLRIAAQEMPKEASILAGAIVKQKSDMFDGSIDAGAAQLRQGLTNLLQEHVYLAGTATGTALSTGLDSEATKGAVDTLDENSVA
ncbi:MAG: hypothetical protein ACR2H3_16505, partial [Acidimicrobiales bacterium]